MSDETVSDFWPNDLPTSPIRTPLAILRQAAAELAMKSKNAFQARISSYRDEVNGEYLTHSLMLIVPGLEGYTREILEVSHNSDLVYPAYIHSSDDPELRNIRCNSEKDLVHALRLALASEYVRTMLYALMAKLSEPALSE